MVALFWISLFLLFYTYLGYGLLLLLAGVLLKRKKGVDESLLPPLTFIIPAYNEEDVIQQKIENTLALDYPPEKLSVLVVTDGSNDRTAEIVGNYPQVLLLHAAERRGKAAAINRAMDKVHTPVVVFSDANTMVSPQALRKLVRHYSDPAVGGVSGEKRIAPKAESAAAFGERLYWRYESLLKKANSDFYTIVGAAGELFSIRASLFRALPEDTVLDDFVLSAGICLQGYRFLYEREAFGVEASSASLREERKRKVRISAGCYQALVRLPGLLNVFRRPRVAVEYLSHRVLRWVACPLALPLLLVSNAVLAGRGAGEFFTVALVVQVLFYMLAVVGGWAAPRGVARPLLLPGYFVFMVLSQWAGFARFVTSRQTALWEKAKRQPPAGGQEQKT